MLVAFVDSSIPLYDLYRMLHPTSILKERAMQQIAQAIQAEGPEETKAWRIKGIVDSWYDGELLHPVIVTPFTPS